MYLLSGKKNHLLLTLVVEARLIKHVSKLPWQGLGKDISVFQPSFLEMNHG